MTDPWHEPVVPVSIHVPAVATEPPTQHFDPEHAPVPHAHMDEH